MLNKHSDYYLELYAKEPGTGDSKKWILQVAYIISFCFHQNFYEVVLHDSHFTNTTLRV